MDDNQSLNLKLEALELINEALQIRIDALEMISPGRRSELMDRYKEEYKYSHLPITADETSNNWLGDLEDRIEQSKTRRVRFVIQKQRREFNFFMPRSRKSDMTVEPEPEEVRERSFDELLASGPMSSGLNNARRIARYFINNIHVSLEKLIEQTSEPRTIVNYYLRLFKTNGYIQYNAEEKRYTATQQGLPFFQQLTGS